MSSDHTSPDPGSDLRRRAEALAASTPGMDAPTSVKDAQRVLHELRVHQIELETQNEELRRAQLELAASQARYFDLYDLAPVGYLTTSEAGLIEEANLTAAAMLGVPRGALVSQPFSRYLLPDDQDVYYLYRRRLLDAAAVHPCELRLCRDAKPPVWVRLDASLATAADGATTIRATLSDITESKRAAQERADLEQKLQQTQRLESLGVLAGGIAHDFNNILMVILGHAEFALEQAALLSPTRSDIVQIMVAVRQGSELCRQMLAYSGRASFTSEQVDLGQLIEQMTQLLGTTISKKADLRLSVAPDLPTVLADPTQLRQVVMNLILNASEALGDLPGTIDVTVSAGKCDSAFLRATALSNELPAGQYVAMQVTDSGCGMDSATLARVFEPFYTTKFTGRGLGLAAVVGIIRAHGGAIRLQSEPGHGSTFAVYLPASDGVQHAAEGQSASDAAWRGTGTVLLAEDEDAVRALASRMLSRLGFQVIVVADGAEAVRRYRDMPSEIALVVLDLTMPHLSGTEALSQMRAVNPNVRAVLASGYSAVELGDRFAELSLVGVLQKPYTLTALRHLLATRCPELGAAADPGASA
ncbi:MAG: response regulator [Armatimonadetes bacterium]|nr:response regulator [Armatimonadota bacterium]